MSSSSVSGNSSDWLTYVNRNCRTCNKKATIYSTPVIIVVLSDGVYLRIQNIEVIKFQETKCQLSVNKL
ncbi:unnamed protein product [Camellia sinensis]